MARILLVEDSQDQTALVRSCLESDHEVASADSAEAARVELGRELPELILLDVGLPGIDGYALAAELRRSTVTEAVPIVFLSARTQSQDKVRGFELGAQDYIEKPFDPAELRARITARLAHRSTRPRVLGHEDLRLDTERMCVSIAGAPETEAELTATEFRLLHFLMSHPGELLSRGRLIEGACNGRIVSERTMDTHVWALRRKLEGSRCHLETVRGAGYRLV